MWLELASARTGRQEVRPGRWPVHAQEVFVGRWKDLYAGFVFLPFRDIGF